MAVSVFDKLEEIYPEIIEMMPGDLFNTHEFMLKLVEEHQELYVQALIEHSQDDAPSLIVIGKIAQKLRARNDLVTLVGSEAIENMYLFRVQK